MKRLLLVTTAAALTTLSLAACSKGNTTTANEAQATNPSTSAAPSTEVTPTTKKSGGTSGTTTKSGSDSPGTTARRGGTTSTTKAGGTPNVPGVPDVPDITNIPGVPGNLNKCIDIATAYAALFAPLAGGYNDEVLQKALAELERIKSEVPDNIKSAMETLENGIKNAKSQGDLVDFLASSEFEEANKKVENYVTVECQSAGGGG